VEDRLTTRRFAAEVEEQCLHADGFGTDLNAACSLIAGICAVMCEYLCVCGILIDLD
jgi:hypothetical protein